MTLLIHMICQTEGSTPQAGARHPGYQGKTQTASGEKAIQQMILAGGPVETAFTVYSDFELYTHGIYKHVGLETALKRR